MEGEGINMRPPGLEAAGLAFKTVGQSAPGASDVEVRARGERKPPQPTDLDAPGPRQLVDGHVDPAIVRHRLARRPRPPAGPRQLLRGSKTCWLGECTHLRMGRSLVKED
mgnify:CR=1 FL=1